MRRSICTYCNQPVYITKGSFGVTVDSEGESHHWHWDCHFDDEDNDEGVD